MTDLRFIQAITSVRSKLEPFLAVGHQQPDFSQSTPSFDPRAFHIPLRTCLPELNAQLAPLGLSEESTQEIVSVLTSESSKYQGVIESSRHQLLEKLSMLPISSNPQELAQLIATACQSLLDGFTNSGLETVHKHLANLELQQESESDDGEAMESVEDSSSDNDDIEDPEAEQDGDDENAPMKPGEEVPPLDTKFLPIFEALHERGKVLTKPEKTYLVNMTGMTYRQITIWFQNRRRGELKEDANIRASSIREGSVHTLDSSDASEDETELEKHLNSATDTTFDIRSWRLTSALATKDGHGVSLPPSPTKLTFGAPATIPGYDTDDTDLSDDEDDEDGVPPGLRVPSLTGSVATLDSATTRSANSSQMFKSAMEPAITSETSPGAGATVIPRPVKSIPLSRRNSPPVSSQPTRPQAPQFNFNFTSAAPTPIQQQFSSVPTSVPAPPPQFVTSNERGLSVEMSITPPLSASTLRSPSPTLPPVPRFTTPPAPATASSPSNSGSRQNSSSPSPQPSSPRPAIKPLPRRTGCAPRPRPPPRAAPAAAPTPSARPSIILPPASNPSLAATTLGALLRPSVPPPAIPSDMQDRLSAMAGRMGVASGPGPVGRNGSVGMQSMSASSPSILPQSSFSFGSVSLPPVGSTGLTPVSVSEQRTSAPTGGSPISS